MRVVCLSEEELALEPSGHGRGAWLCAEKPVSCAEAALRQRRFPAAFRRPVGRSAVERLIALLRAGGQESS